MPGHIRAIATGGNPSHCALTDRRRLIVVIVFDAAVVGFCSWGVVFGNLRTWIPSVPIVVGVPSIIFYWWAQKRRWPAQQL